MWSNFGDEKSRNGDTLGPVKLSVWPEQCNQGDWREQDDQGKVSIIIFGMSKSSGFQKYSICWVFWHFVCVFVFVVVFVIVFVFVFVSSYDFWIAFIISFQNMYGYRGLWSLRAEIMVIFEVMTDRQTDRHTDSKSTYRLGPSGRMVRVKTFIDILHTGWFEFDRYVRAELSLQVIYCIIGESHLKSIFN